nr:C10 family peptidase [Chloroflexota bacterium]
MSEKSIVWAYRSLFSIVVALTFTLSSALMRYTGMAAPPDNDHIATCEEARTVAENWLRLIVERDGQWSGEKHPSIDNLTELRRGDLLLGYYASVQPQGYVVISFLKDFPPIRAYSIDSSLNPDAEGGMADLLKDVAEAQIKFLIQQFGGLEKARTEEIDESASIANRLAWLYLLQGAGSLPTNLRSLYAQSSVQVGPLLKTSWHQRAPYNFSCPEMIGDEACANAVVGCVQLATAQVMRYFHWPPYYSGAFRFYFDWPNMLNRYVRANGWFNDENGNPVTQAQIDAVAALCAIAGQAMYTDYGCDITYGALCHWLVDDARDALEDDFFYSNPDLDQPYCEERDSYSLDEWWNIIKQEIDNNRPVVYRIATGAVFISDFDHAIVVDGYDNTGGLYQVHANYGWDDPHTAWYTLDNFDCDNAPGWQGGCSWDEEELIRHIYPRTGHCGVSWGTLGPRNSATDLPHYIYCDVIFVNTTIQGGAWVQFLPGTSITGGSASAVTIEGRSPGETRFYSEGLTTRGLKVAAGGKIKLHSNGSIRVR